MEIPEDIKQKASKCLHCQMPQCSIKGCPINTKIPDFIDAIKNQNLELAFKILHQNNSMSHICGLVCPQEKQCEGSCVWGIKDTPVEIGKLEVFINEWAEKNNLIYDEKDDLVKTKDEIKDNNSINSNKKVAIIGSGPCGLECAFQLTKLGINVDIYDKNEKPGGVMTYGIPDFRLDKKLVLDICGKMLKNVNYINSTLDKDLFETIKKEYDAVLISIGLTKSSSYKLTDEECDDIYLSNDFLLSYLQNKKMSLGKVVVIGGGNVAMDSARVAIHLGAKESSIFYRRDEEHMPASKKELVEAKEEGVNFCEKIRVISANVENKKLKSINCIKTQIIDGKAVDIEGTEFIKECDTVVFAIGQKPDSELIKSLGLEQDDYNNIKVDEIFQTSQNGVFSAGDVIGTTATICNAIKSGRKASIAIDNFLKQ
jgi:glutamate synthase (NADPH/NADH) small chain